MYAQMVMDNQTILELAEAEKNVYLADSLIKVEQIDNAYIHLDKASRAYEKVEVWEKYIIAFNKIGAKLIRMNKPDEATMLLEKTFPIAKGITDTLGAADSLHKLCAENFTLLGRALRDKGDYDSSLELYLKALDIEKSQSKKGDNDPRLGKTYYSIGAIYYRQHKHKESLEYNQKAINMQLQMFGNEHIAIAATYRNLGLNHANLNNYEAAIENYLKAKEIYIKVSIPDDPKIASLETDLGMVYEKRGNVKEARESCVKALKILEANFEKAHPEFAINYNTLGKVSLQENNVESAIAYFEKGLNSRLIGLSNKHPMVAESYLYLGNAYQQKGDLETALKNYQQALVALVEDFNEDDLAKNPDLTGIVYSYNYLLDVLRAKALALKDLFKNTSIRSLLQESFTTYQKCVEVIGKIVREQEGILYKPFDEEVADKVFDEAMNVIYQLCQSARGMKEKGYYLNHFLITSEQHRKYEWLSALKIPELKNYGHIDSVLVRKEKELKIDLAYYTHKLTEEKQGREFANKEKIENLESKVRELNTKFAGLKEDLKRLYPHYYNLKYRETAVELSEVYEYLKNDFKDWAFLVFYESDTLLYKFYVSKQEAFILHSPLSEVLKEQCINMNEAITDYAKVLKGDVGIYNNYVQSAHYIYNFAFSDVLNLVQMRMPKMLVLPDGALSGIPIDALLTQFDAEGEKSYRKLHYLIKEFKLVYAVSMEQFFNSCKRKKRNSGHISIYGSKNQDLLSVRERNRMKSGIYDRLQEEIALINETMKTDFLKEIDATEYNIKKIMPGKRTLHVASTVQIDNERPLSSGIILSEDLDKKDDGILNFYEIYGMNDMKNDFISFSNIMSDEELYSWEHLTNALSYAGCSSVLINRWFNQDAIGNDFMWDLYKKVKKGEVLADALYEVKNTYIEQEEKDLMAHPYFWASPFLVGNPDAIRSSLNIPLLLMGFAVFLLGFFYFWNKKDNKI